MANNRILFLAPASIPVYEAEAIVNVKLLKLLVSKGYRIDVISKKAKWKRYPLMLEDELQKELSSVTIIEVDNVSIDLIEFVQKTLRCYVRGVVDFDVFRR